MVNKKRGSKSKSSLSKEIQAVRDKLLTEKAMILEELMNLKGESLHKSLKDSSGDLSGYSIHMADMATDLYDREFSLELAEGERARLYELDDAIKRIDHGEYGVCTLCGEAIAKARLKVMPQAEYCIKCREKTEKTRGK